MRLITRKLIAALFVSAAVPAVHAAPITLNEIASKTVLTNPEVLAKWHEFKASGFERDVVWGRNLPTLDVMFGTARETRESPLYTPPGSTRNYTSQTGAVTVRQNIFEGFATLNDTKRIEHATLVRFYEMLDLSESAAYEATSAYIDVWRHRKLVEFAEQNYVTHRLAYAKIKERAQSGVGRQVDMETAAGRLALAESNLVTESANLHDVTARFHRVVGVLPQADMEPPPSAIAKEFPVGHTDSIKAGFEKSPRLKAAFENVLSAKRNMDVQKSGFYPRVDAYAEKSRDRNESGYDGTTNESTIGLTATWNLFRGNQDASKKRKAAEEINIAKDLREKVCREVRQNLSMSFNDHFRITEQLSYLDQHQLSTDKVRTAFRSQFDIGQRSLLDLLDIENEYYTAQRDYLNAEMDLKISDAKYLATSGNLLNTLNLKKLDMTPPKPVTAADADMLATCPVESDSDRPADKEAMFNLALEKDRLNRAKDVPAPVEALTPKQIILTAKPVVITGANFDYKSDVLKEEAEPALRQVVEFATKYQDANMEVVGHTDSIASQTYNLDLSARRAESVKRWLVANGVNADRIVTRGVGKLEPVASNKTDEGRLKNRRVEIHYTVHEPE